MSKAARICALYAEGKTVSEIAAIVGCLPAYVRVCARQRAGGGMSKIDRRWYEKSGRKWGQAYKRRYLKDPANRKRHNANCLKSYYRRKARAGVAAFA